MNFLLYFLLLFLLTNKLSSSNIKLTREEQSNKCVCGVENNFDKQKRIISGFEIKPELRFPWLVPLVYNNGSLFCAGTLINSRYILTSAHCFHYSKQDAAGEMRTMISSDAILVPERITHKILVGIGIHNLKNQNQIITDSNIKPQWQTIDYAIVHRFYENLNYSIKHDIALIRLKKEIDFEQYNWLRPICLPEENNFELDNFNKYQLENIVEPGERMVYSNLDETNLKNKANLYSLDSSEIVENNFKLNERINSKRLNLDNLNKTKKVFRRDVSLGLIENNKVHTDSFFNVGWGSTKIDSIDISKVPLWMQVDMLSREECINLNGENVKWNFLCAKSQNSTQKSTVGDSGGPLFGKIKRKSSENNYLKDKFPIFKLTQANTIKPKISYTTEFTTLPTTKNIFVDSTTMRSTIKLKTSTKQTTTIKLTTSRPTTKYKTTATSRLTTNKKITTKPTLKITSTIRPTIPNATSSYINFNLIPEKSTTSFEQKIFETRKTPKTTKNYFTIPSRTTSQIKTFYSTTNRPNSKLTNKPLQSFKQTPKRQNNLNEKDNTIMTKVQENNRRHFYSAIIYEDLFKGFNLPADDLSKIAKEILDEEDFDENFDRPNEFTNFENKPDFSNNIKNDENKLNLSELDLKIENYVQLGITSWSLRLYSEIGMYTDVRAYLGWIKRNTKDAKYCSPNPFPSDDKIPVPTTKKPDLPDPLITLDCGAEKLKNVQYPWLVSLFFDEKFLGNCVYFFSNFVICSDTYTEQPYSDLNQLAAHLVIHFYYPKHKFRVVNIVNRLLNPTGTMGRKEYLIIQLDDPDNLLHHNNISSRKFNRASIDSLINKNNPQAICISTRDYPISEEASNLVSYYIYEPSQSLIVSQLKLTSFRKCRQISPTFVTKRFLCAEVGVTEETNISNQLFTDSFILNKPETITSNFTTQQPLSSRIRNFFRIKNQSSRLNREESIFKNNLFNDLIDKLPFDEILFRRARESIDSNQNIKELFDGQPVFHKIDEQYTLIGFIVKPPFPHSVTFKRQNLILILDLKKFRFQLISKILKSLRFTNRN